MFDESKHGSSGWLDKARAGRWWVTEWMDGWTAGSWLGPCLSSENTAGKRLYLGLKGSAVLSPEALRRGAGNRGRRGSRTRPVNTPCAPKNPGRQLTLNLSYVAFTLGKKDKKDLPESTLLFLNKYIKFKCQRQTCKVFLGVLLWPEPCSWRGLRAGRCS